MKPIIVKGSIYDVGYKPWTFKMSNKAIFWNDHHLPDFDPQVGTTAENNNAGGKEAAGVNVAQMSVE